MMAGLQVQMTAPGRHIGNDNAKNILANGALDLYYGLAPADATESLLSMLAISVANASLDCLTQAAGTSPDYLESRDLRHGLKGAAVAADLIKILDARRGHSAPRRVSVGSVNVEAGGQAIVGNVESRRLSDNSEACASEVVVHSSKPEALGRKLWPARIRGTPRLCLRGPAAARGRAAVENAVPRR